MLNTILHCDDISIYHHSPFSISFVSYTENLRVGAALLWFCQRQVFALDHEDLQFTQLLDIVQRKLHCALHLNVSEVSIADTGHTATDLSLESQTNKEIYLCYYSQDVNGALCGGVLLCSHVCKKDDPYFMSSFAFPLVKVAMWEISISLLLTFTHL